MAIQFTMSTKPPSWFIGTGRVRPGRTVLYPTGFPGSTKPAAQSSHLTASRSLARRSPDIECPTFAPLLARAVVSGCQASIRTSLLCTDTGGRRSPYESGASAWGGTASRASARDPAGRLAFACASEASDRRQANSALMRRLWPDPGSSTINPQGVREPSCGHFGCAFVVIATGTGPSGEPSSGNWPAPDGASQPWHTISPSPSTTLFNSPAPSWSR